MASSTGYDYGIRQALVQKGVNNADIGYDSKSGYVTVQGQNAIKAPKVYQGTAYTSQQDFNSQWDAYNKSLQQAQSPAQSPVQSYSPYSTSNPYDQKYQDQYSLLQGLINQAPVNVQDIYNSPQYAAQQAQAQRGAQQAVRAAQEAYGGAGFGRSLALGERSQGIQNEANEYLQLQVLPQLIAAEENRRQQQLQNQQSMLSALFGQQQLYDSRSNAENQLAIQRGQLTGSYIDPQAQRIIDSLLNLKANTEQNWMGMTPDQRVSAGNEADLMRAQLASMGYDPSLFGANVKSNVASANRSQAGIQTLAAQNQAFNQDMMNRNFERGVFESDRTFDYQQARDAIADERYKLEFDEDMRRYGLDYALKKAQLNNQIANTQNDNEYRWASLNWQKDENNPDNVYRQLQIDALRKEISGESKEMKAELEGLFNGLSTGQLNPNEAIEEINNRVRMGLTTSEDAKKLNAFVQQYIEGGSTPKPQNVDQKLLQMTPEQLLKAWETDPTGKAAGRAKYDWRSWILDPQGYKAGRTYELWKSQFGPSLGG